MSDPSKPPPETSMQRALRMKKAALSAKPKPPGDGKLNRPAAGIAAGASKPASRK